MRDEAARRGGFEPPLLHHGGDIAVGETLAVEQSRPGTIAHLLTDVPHHARGRCGPRRTEAEVAASSAGMHTNRPAMRIGRLLRHGHQEPAGYSGGGRIVAISNLGGLYQQYAWI
jgi:hypothetical protein